MSFATGEYSPRNVMEYFLQISEIPRSSGNERKIAEFIEQNAIKKNLFCKRDRYNNVFVRYTPPVAKYPPILLQGHIDMVCVKTSESNHNFECDALELAVEGGFLYAKDTSLGADNGIGVAMMLAALDEKPEREVECLFTSSEETGMDGAKGFDYSIVHSRTMINLDSEDEHEAVISCAGGVNICAEKAMPTCLVNGSALKITLTGFAGGHSGSDIHLGRINATRQLAKILDKLCEKFDCRLISIDGGEKSNAIPSTAKACIMIDLRADSEAVELFKRVKRTFGQADLCADILLERYDYRGLAFDTASSAQMCRFIAKTKNGVVSVYDAINLVKTSINTGIIKTDGSKIFLDFSLRSSDINELERLKDDTLRELNKIGAKCELSGAYPAWEVAQVSELQKTYCEAYHTVYGAEPKICGIHAGLECGFVKSALPDMDMISIGPTMYNVHTVLEKLDLSSCERFWRVLRRVILGG